MFQPCSISASYAYARLIDGPFSSASVRLVASATEANVQTAVCTLSVPLAAPQAALHSPSVAGTNAPSQTPQTMVCFVSSTATHAALHALTFNNTRYKETEADPELQTLVSSLIGGPVGPSDAIGSMNRTRLLQTCMADGTLLKPLYDDPTAICDASVDTCCMICSLLRHFLIQCFLNTCCLF